MLPYVPVSSVTASVTPHPFPASPQQQYDAAPTVRALVSSSSNSSGVAAVAVFVALRLRWLPGALPLPRVTSAPAGAPDARCCRRNAILCTSGATGGVLGGPDRQWWRWCAGPVALGRCPV